jgi:AcrR family transcriptional regulator
MNTPNNARSVLSKSKIKQALVGLLDTHKLPDITIGNICEKAGINRTTFYSHFADIADLFKAFEGELCAQLEKLFMYDPDIAETGNAIDIFKATLEVIKKYKNLYKTHLLKIFDGSMIEKVMDKLKGKYMPKLMPDADMTPEMQDCYFTFLKSGIIGIIKDWVKKDCPESCEQLAKNIMAVINQVRSAPVVEAK